MSTNIIPRRYYGHFVAEPSIYNPFDDLPKKDMTILFTCARDGCGQVEASKGQFMQCTKCLTRYCCQECYDKDHATGQHKAKCIRFGIMKAKMEQTLCKECWTKRWNEIQDPSGSRPYILCYKCTKKEAKLEADLKATQGSIMDQDIIRVWFH